MTTVEIAFAQHKGRVCREQQDCLLVGCEVIQADEVPIVSRRLAAEDLVLALADGVALSPAPARASRIVLEEIARTLSERPEWRQEGFISARHLRHVQQRLADRLGRSHRTQGAATTLALAHLRGDAAVILNAGDSRVYQVDAQGGWLRLSKDHTLLQGMIDRGEAQPGKAYASLYDALDSVLVADYEDEGFAIHRATTVLTPGACLVLCTDGVHAVLGEAEMWRRFDPDRGPAEQLKAWQDRIWTLGAPDNLSLIIAEAAEPA